MFEAEKPAEIWTRWLIAACVIVMLYGLSLMVAPQAMLGVFSLIYFSSRDHFAAFPAEARDYIVIAHGVLGSVTFGWGLTLLFITLGPFRRGSAEGWRMLAFSLIAWSVPEALFSVWMGSIPNLAFSLAFGLLFIAPLVATRGIGAKTP